jgi:Domain of unknown function (DUF4188)
MKTRVERRTVDLSCFPDLVVIYLSMRVRGWRGLRTLHLGMRWYWQDYDAMERWTRSEPQRDWWLKFLRDSGGTGFWRETYYRRGGMEAIYADMDKPVGLQVFAPGLAARGSAFSARQRPGLEGDGPAPPVGAPDAEAA